MHVQTTCRSLFRTSAVLLTTTVAGAGMALLSTPAAHADPGPGSPSGWCTASWSPSTIGAGDSADLTVTLPTGSDIAYGMLTVDGHLWHTGASRGYDTYYPNGQNSTWYYSDVSSVLSGAGATTGTLGIRVYNAATHDINSITDTTPYDCGTSVTLATSPPPPSPSTLHLTGPAGVALSTGRAAVHPSSTSPVPISTVSTTPSVCAVSGNTVTLRAAGTCTLRATQPSDANHLAPTPVTLSFPVWAAPALPTAGRTTQVLTVLGQGETALRPATGGVCTVVPGGRVVLTQAGSCTVLVRNASGALVRAHRIQVSDGKPATGLRESVTAYFSYNSAALTKAGKQALRAAVPALRHASLVIVYGNTDGPAGNGPSSMTLSTQRAKAVATYLRSAGVGARFELVPLAHLAPVSRDAAKNRRADVFYLPTTG